MEVGKMYISQNNFDDGFTKSQCTSGVWIEYFAHVEFFSKVKFVRPNATNKVKLQQNTTRAEADQGLLQHPRWNTL